MLQPAAWGLVGLTVLAQISYPLVAGDARTAVTVGTVCLGFAAAVCSAATRGVRVAAVLVLVTAGGGLLVEAVGTRSGLPFGSYAYTGSLGAELAGVPWVIPLAWTMMAWPAWAVAGRLVGSGRRRVLVAGWGLAAWDLFLDPQMVDAGHWVWRPGDVAGLPGVPGIPWTNYAGWLVVGVAMMAVMPRVGVSPGSDAPMLAFYLWTYFSSVLAHAAFFGLPASAAWGGVGMGVVALPLAVALCRSTARGRSVVGAKAEVG